jgi:quercetin dioxygenase-like cupin family protein
MTSFISIQLSAIQNPQSAIPSVAGSPLWQVVFISFGAILILFETLRGWRLGLMRQVMRLIALEGDPTKEGPFVVRFQFPEGYHVPPHTHPKTERVTVISGTLYLATGEALDRNSAKKLPAGSFGYWPAGMKHTAWSEGETVIQLHGIGPWQINYVNPADDPRNANR